MRVASMLLQVGLPYLWHSMRDVTNTAVTTRGCTSQLEARRTSVLREDRCWMWLSREVL